MRELINRHQPKLQAEEDRRLVSFLFPRDRMDSEVVLIQANYLDIAQDLCIAGGAKQVVAS